MGWTARRNDEDNYRWISALNAVAMQRYRERDLDGLRGILQKYTKLLELFDEDPQLSTLETATAQCILMLAESNLDHLNFDDCLELCADVKEIMECKTARYVARGDKPRPDSMVWSQLVCILGDAKWKGPAELRDRVCNLDEMVAIYELAETSVRKALKRYPRSHIVRSSQLELLAWCGMQVIRAQMRWRRDAVGRLKQRYKEYHGAILDVPRHPFYWYIRLCELYLSRCTNRQEYVASYSNFRLAYLNMHGAQADLSAYDASSANELEYLLRTAGKRPSLIEFCSSKTS